MRNTLKAYERLKKEQHIDTLFRTGKAFSVFPLRVLYRVVPRAVTADPPVLAGFSVPKKKFGGSVERHRIVRLMREAYRLNKHGLYDAVPAGLQLHIFLIFSDVKLPVYTTVQDAAIKALDKLAAIAVQSPE